MYSFFFENVSKKFGSNGLIKQNNVVECSELYSIIIKQDSSCVMCMYGNTTHGLLHSGHVPVPRHDKKLWIVPCLIWFKFGAGEISGQNNVV